MMRVEGKRFVRSVANGDSLSLPTPVRDSYEGIVYLDCTNPYKIDFITT